MLSNKIQNKSKYKVIYSLDIHIELQLRGFKHMIELDNCLNPKYKSWAYEATPELLEAFDQILEERGHSRSGK